MKKFPVNMVISILQAFNCQRLEIFVHDKYFVSFWNKDMSDFGSQNIFNHVLLEVKLHETKREKLSGLFRHTVFLSCVYVQFVY